MLIRNLSKWHTHNASQAYIELANRAFKGDSALSGENTANVRGCGIICRQDSRTTSK